MKALLRTGLLLLPALLLLGLLPATSSAQIGIAVSINTAPPELPVYSQPPCPDEGYLWQPGYWAWGPDGYYWVPGMWVEPPQPGLFWTPGYWAFQDGDYVWNDGYWGPEVGFYGGVDYGFGYPGEGFYGGMWQGNVFRYNVVVWHVGGGFHNTYRAPVAWHRPWNSRASFNGGRGIPARPTPQDERAMHARHFQPTREQVQQRDTAAHNPDYQFKNNHGKPQHPAMARPSGAPARNMQHPEQKGRQNAHPNNARPGMNHTQKPRPQTETSKPMGRVQRAQPSRQATPTRPRTENQSRPQSRPAAQPHPQSRPETMPQSRPQPRQQQERPQSRPAPRPQPESRPAERPQSRPESRPAPQPHPQSRPEARPAPHPEARPQSHPAPHPESHPKAPEKPHSQG